MQELIEVWKPIKGFENIYEISNMGRVKSLQRRLVGANNAPYTIKGKMLNPQIPNSHGYVIVTLSLHCKLYRQKIHLLVWDHFGYKPRNGRLLQVDHIDNNKLNNRIDNLQLLTQEQNISKSKLLMPNKTSIYTGVCYDKKTNKWFSQINISKKHIFLGRYNTPEEARLIYLYYKNFEACLNKNEFVPREILPEENN